MRRIIGGWIGVVAVLAAAAGGADFSRSLPPGDFRDAGLGKLSEAELARLDALVAAFHAGRKEEPRPAGRRPENPAIAAVTEVPDRGASVVVAPGTKVEYAAVQSRLTGNFTGWEPRGVFALENGQRWREANGSTYATPPLPSPKVRVTPGALGSFWMEIEGVRTRVKVVRVDTGR